MRYRFITASTVALMVGARAETEGWVGWENAKHAFIL